jgi:hypothetical protein
LGLAQEHPDLLRSAAFTDLVIDISKKSSQCGFGGPGAKKHIGYH